MEQKSPRLRGGCIRGLRSSISSARGTAVASKPETPKRFAYAASRRLDLIGSQAFVLVTPAPELKARLAHFGPAPIEMLRCSEQRGAPAFFLWLERVCAAISELAGARK